MRTAAHATGDADLPLGRRPRGSARRGHICAGTRLAPATIRAGTGLTAAAFAPGDSARPCHNPQRHACRCSRSCATSTRAASPRRCRCSTKGPPRAPLEPRGLSTRATRRSRPPAARHDTCPVVHRGDTWRHACLVSVARHIDGLNDADTRACERAPGPLITFSHFVPLQRASGPSHQHRDWAHRSHICTGTGLTAPTSAPGLGSPLPHLQRDWAHRSHICTGTGPSCV